MVLKVPLSVSICLILFGETAKISILQTRASFILQN